MIEFTISRVALCACGMILIISVTGVLNGVYEKDTYAMDEDLADRFAYMLDVFQSSEDDTLVLDGTRILPEGYTAHVHDGFVELMNGDSKHIALTDYQGEFILGWRDTKVIIHQRSQRSF